MDVLLDDLLQSLVEIDDSLMRVDTNTAVKKVHESIAKIKKFKEENTPCQTTNS